MINISLWNLLSWHKMNVKKINARVTFRCRPTTWAETGAFIWAAIIPTASNLSRTWPFLVIYGSQSASPPGRNRRMWASCKCRELIEQGVKGAWVCIHRWPYRHGSLMMNAANRLRQFSLHHTHTRTHIVLEEAAGIDPWHTASPLLKWKQSIAELSLKWPWVFLQWNGKLWMRKH